MLKLFFAHSTTSTHVQLGLNVKNYSFNHYFVWPRDLVYAHVNNKDKKMSEKKIPRRIFEPNTVEGTRVEYCTFRMLIFIVFA